MCVDAVNAFGASRYRELDATHFSHLPLTAPTPLLSLDIAHAFLNQCGLAGAVQPPPAASSFSSRVGTSDSFGTSVSASVTSNGHADAVLIWHHLHMQDGEGDVLSTGPDSPGSHFRQCAYMLEGGGVDVEVGMRVSLRGVVSEEYGLHVELGE